jgi:hypothetical protein
MKGVRGMIKKICLAIIGVSLFMGFGIIGGIECGAPMTNALWLIPVLILLLVAMKIHDSIEG